MNAGRVMQKADTPDYNFKVYEAIVFGIVLSFALQWNNPTDAVPLFDFYPELISGKIIACLMTLIWLLVLFQKKYFKSLIGLIIVAFLLVSIFKYSSNFAFRHFTIYIVAFIYVFNHQDKRCRAVGSSLALASLFLFSAFHKINNNYLSGVEFQRGGSFVAFLDLLFPGTSPLALGPLMNFLPLASIVLEFAIAFGLILRPKLFVHIAGLFLLSLCLLNPPVLSVYFMLLPLFISVSSGYEKLLEKLPFSNTLKTPYFWAFYLYISTTRIYELEYIIMTNYVLVLIFVLVHFKILLSYKKENKILLEYEPVDFKQGRVWIIPILMGLTFFGSLSFLPSPFGFKMFSGRRFETKFLSLIINQREACEYSSKRWQYSPVADIKWTKINSDSCQILLPTEGAVSYVARHICQGYHLSEFSLTTSDSHKEVEFNCSNYRERISSNSL